MFMTARAPGKREQNTAETRAKIIAAARSRFARQGFAATTTRQIADDAGIAHGTLFRYAPTREDLVQLLFDDSIGAAFADILEAWPRLGRLGSFTDVAMHCYARFIDVYAADVHLARVLVKELPFLQGDSGERQHESSGRLLQLLLEDLAVRQADGDIAADVVPFVVATASFALYYGALLALVTGQLSKEAALIMLRGSHQLLEKGSST